MSRKIVIFCILLLAPMAYARSSDITLHRLVSPAGTANTDLTAFNNLIGDFGTVIAGLPQGPADTLGLNGFELSFDFAMSQYDDGAAHWVDAIEDQNPTGNFEQVLFSARKGLPFSLEFGSTYSYLFNTRMSTLGGYVKWALFEGYPSKAWPDVALRGSVTQLLGNAQLNLTTWTGDFIISRAIPMGGVIQLTPYAGYQLLSIVGSSNVVDVTPEIDPALAGNAPDLDKNIFFDEATVTRHRGVAGFRYLYGSFATYVEAAFTADVQTYMGRVAFNL